MPNEIAFQDAIQAFAAWRFDQLALSLVARLAGRKPLQIAGIDSDAPNLWEQHHLEVREAPNGAMCQATELRAKREAHAIASALAREEAALLVVLAPSKKGDAVESIEGRILGIVREIAADWEEISSELGRRHVDIMNTPVLAHVMETGGFGDIMELFQDGVGAVFADPQVNLDGLGWDLHDTLYSQYADEWRFAYGTNRKLADHLNEGGSLDEFMVEREFVPFLKAWRRDYLAPHQSGIRLLHR